MNINYKLWPNTDGNLGNLKVQIPTGIGDDEWPDGDALVHNFVYKDGKLAGFVDTKALTVNDSKSTIINYDCVDIELPFTEGEIVITRGERSKYFNVRYNPINNDNVVITLKYKGCKTLDDVRTVDRNYRANDIVNDAWSEGLGDLEIGYYIEMVGGWEEYMGMFHGCRNLTSFTSDLSSLTDGTVMFCGCSLTTFNADLPKLTNGNNMFYANDFTTFTADLPSLTDGSQMFGSCENLTSFSSDLSNLTDAYCMFEYCSKLTSFSSDLPSLTYGERMFSGCTRLTSFTADLSSLTSGRGMFNNCKLDAASVKNIIDIVNMELTELTLGMGCNDTAEDKDRFAQEVGYADMTSLLAALQAKIWHINAITAQYNSRPTTTYSLRRPSAEGTLPVFVKLEELEETEKHADYTSEDGSKKYRLNWFHETTGSTEGYTQFASLEEAIETLNIKPIERN